MEHKEWKIKEERDEESLWKKDGDHATCCGGRLQDEW